MRDRKPEPWESGAPSPFLLIDTAQGNVAVGARVRTASGSRRPVGMSRGMTRQSGLPTRWLRASGWWEADSPPHARRPPRIRCKSAVAMVPDSAHRAAQVGGGATACEP
jgi:hypothetical protein